MTDKTYLRVAIRKKLYGDQVFKQNKKDIKEREKRLKQGEYNSSNQLHIFLKLSNVGGAIIPFHLFNGFKQFHFYRAYICIEMAKTRSVQLGKSLDLNNILVW